MTMMMMMMMMMMIMMVSVLGDGNGRRQRRYHYRRHQGILFLGVAPRPVQLLHEVVLGPKSIHSEVSDLARLAPVICLLWFVSEQARIAYREALPPQCNGYSEAMEFHKRDRGRCLLFIRLAIVTLTFRDES